MGEASWLLSHAEALGDFGSKEDADAMRRSGLTHLLSVSGLHIAAVVGAAMLLTLKLLALSPALANRVNLVLVAAGVGAGVGTGVIRVWPELRALPRTTKASMATVGCPLVPETTTVSVRTLAVANAFWTRTCVGLYRAA